MAPASKAAGGRRSTTVWSDPPPTTSTDAESPSITATASPSSPAACWAVWNAASAVRSLPEHDVEPPDTTHTSTGTAKTSSNSGLVSAPATVATADARSTAFSTRLVASTLAARNWRSYSSLRSSRRLRIEIIVPTSNTRLPIRAAIRMILILQYRSSAPQVKARALRCGDGADQCSGSTVRPRARPALLRPRVAVACCCCP